MWLLSTVKKNKQVVGRDYDTAQELIAPLVEAVNSDEVVSIFCGGNSKPHIDGYAGKEGKPTHLIIYRWPDGDESISLRRYHPEALRSEISLYNLQVANSSTETKLSEILYINLKTGLTDFELIANKGNVKGQRRWTIKGEF